MAPYESDDCWPWTAAKDRDGYGVFTPDTQTMIQWRAHRFAYYLCWSPIPNGMVVCHTCDNPSCVRPDHLRLGSTGDNNHERDQRGRGARGETHYRAKLNKAKAAEIRRRYEPGRPKYAGNGEDLMAEFGISRSTFYRVIKGELWV